MVLNEYSDVIQWGLHLFDSDPVYGPGYYSDMIQHDADDIYSGQYLQVHYDTDSNNIENDEIIAHTLQEEFAQLEIAESSRYQQQHPDEDRLLSSGFAYDWNNSSMVDYCSAGVVDAEPSSSCSSPSDREYPLDLVHEYALDDEVGQRLSQMIPIPHVPRINGEIPSIDVATSDHQRLLDRLQLYDFIEHKVQGDGNCQFRALSDQLYHTPEHHKLVRQSIVNQLKTQPEIYKEYVPMEYGDYLEQMSKSGEWGDHVTLQAAADSYGTKIFVIASFKDTCCIEILPHIEKPKRVIFLSFWAEVHYNSIYPQGDIPSSELRKKKKWWVFGNKH
ncbi:OTU domain-containing protein [Quillaja saponaria]|uniref:ubiquitinyl hydrolase 1 n=1 Tax=Quillaja saponaria TaxID=32244 RepID=A0AAD7Q0A1_QUISA|nr:OTU domain-containing protein [Quillaja saponaria]